MKPWQLVYFALPILLVAIDYINGAKILERLQKNSPTVWQRIGPVNLTDSNISPNRLLLARFIWTFSFLKVDDRNLQMHCILAMAIQLALAACLVGALMLL